MPLNKDRSELTIHMRFKHLIVAALIGVAAFGQAQTPGKAIIVKNKVVVETTAQIMRREATQGPKLPIRKIKSNETEHEFERDHLPQNPASPASATWPAQVNDVPVRASGATGATGTGNGRDVLPPLFSVPVNFGGPQVGESGYVPPDSDGDVSLSSVIVAANGRIKSYDRLGNLGSLNASTDVFFASVRGSGTSDPRVVFDRITKRWFIAMIDVTNTNNRICLAVSNQEAINASTTWQFFQFAQNIGSGPSGFADYETLGVDANGVYIGTNRFSSSFNCDLFAINKASLLAGTLAVTPFRNLIASNTGMFTPWPCTNDDPTANVAFIVGVDYGVYGKLDYRRVTYSAGTFSISANASITVPTTYSPPAMPVPVSATTTGSVDSLDDRLFYARVCRNRITGEVNVQTAHGIRMNSSGVGGSSGDRAGARWYSIGNVFSGTATLNASGSVLDGSASAFKYVTIPSLAMNGQGHQFVGFSIGNATTSPGVGGYYRLSTDGFLGTAPTTIVNGANYYNVEGTTSTQRWGDYSFTMVDPRDMMSIWSFQEYCNANNSWQVRAIKVLAPAPTVTGFTPTSATQGQTLNVVVTGTGIFDPDSTYPDHLALNFGSNVTVNSVTWNNATQATVNITVGAAAATGARTVTLTNPDGQTATGSFTIDPGVKTIAGTLSLASYTGSVSNLQFVYELRDASTNALIETQTLTGLGAGNTFSFTTSQAAGNYKLRIKGVNRFLAKSQSVTVSATGVSGLNYALANGDSSGDNLVGNADFNIIRAAWGATSSSSNWNEAADLNGDGVIGNADFNIMRANWGSAGDN